MCLRIAWYFVKNGRLFGRLLFNVPRGLFIQSTSTDCGGGFLLFNFPLERGRLFFQPLLAGRGA